MWEVLIKKFEPTFIKPYVAEGWEAIDAQGSAGELLTYWDVQRFEGYLLKVRTYSLTIKLIDESTGLSWMFSNIYGPHNEPDRHVLFSELNSVKATNTLPLVLIGDFPHATLIKIHCPIPW